MVNDINAYANERLLDFMDAAHTEVSSTLRDHFGTDWVDHGVRKHCDRKYFTRVEAMLHSPMRVVEMERTDEEIYGIEHLWQIINGNWSLFEQTFENKTRTEAYLSEITELRHNLAHRRNRHYLLRSSLVRIMGSCQMILTALKSPSADIFSDIVDSLSSGGMPWGAPLEGRLPPRDEMYSEFVGRPDELEGLSQWLASDSPQVLVWGYGGVGKSALAYKFARDIRDSSSENLIAVCWLSAKRVEYADGTVRARLADFADLKSFMEALWRVLYNDSDMPADLTLDIVLQELRELPILLVVDDFDTISEDIELTEFLLYSLRGTLAKVIYTSRHRVPALRNLEVPPFDEKELRDFVLQKALAYSADQAACIKRLNAIRSVTGGYPLFVGDLIHHAAFFGIDQAVRDWTQKKGDEARQYALRRQIEYLSNSSGSSGDVLIALSAANKALKIVELSAIAGLTDDDSEAGIKELLTWRMVNQVIEEDSATPAFRMNNNTSRLVRQTFRNDERMKTFSDASKALSGARVPEAKRAAIAKVIAQTKVLLRDGNFEAAKDHLLESMTGELANSADLTGVLGWLYSRQPLEDHVSLARDAFERSHRLGSSKVDTYYHWASLERRIAENMVIHSDAKENDIAAQWKKSEDVALVGIDRCGSSQILYYLAGYGASREAKAKHRAKSFTYSEAAYERSIGWYTKALAGPVSDVATIPVGAIYRGMTLAYEGIKDFEKLQKTLTLWRDTSERDNYFDMECRRLVRLYPQHITSPEFRAML